MSGDPGLSSHEWGSFTGSSGGELALAGAARLVGCWPLHQESAVRFPVKRTCPGFGLDLR